MPARTILTTLHGRTVPGVPRWAERTAYAITLLALPSCVWRIAAINLNAPLLDHDATAPAGPEPFDGEWWYLIGLSVFSEALAFLAVGLVARWGEVWPRWVPVLHGRPVPVLAAALPAGLGSVALLVFPYAMVMSALGLKITGEPEGMAAHGWQVVAFWIAYLPLTAWGPLLGILTVHYYRRRRSAPSGQVDVATRTPLRPVNRRAGTEGSSRPLP
ncbi:hypothetical protein ACWCYK_04550 [Streptomyces lydicamycinicus]|uniref:Uncharacterized protein n=1 Tax=Streptomyces lydicamycinicus TaxID=1546107 RepID=A0A0P4R5T0_9ACTN|nr:hypothetical protein [Streptomyces lydicamycinicus]GAO07724.1 hypothetical protein TPA0598_03_01850 [Streptomyces lydicamycinicus]